MEQVNLDETCDCEDCQDSRSPSFPLDDNLLLMVKDFGVVVRPAYCPDCNYPVTNPDKCFHCDYGFQVSGEKISIAVRGEGEC